MPREFKSGELGAVYAKANPVFCDGRQLMTKKWAGGLGVPGCDFCKNQPSRYFVDGKTRIGPWAIMCEKCYPVYGVGKFGPGLGQKYDLETLEKVDG